MNFLRGSLTFISVCRSHKSLDFVKAFSAFHSFALPHIPAHMLSDGSCNELALVSAVPLQTTQTLSESHCVLKRLVVAGGAAVRSAGRLTVQE